MSGVSANSGFTVCGCSRLKVEDDWIENVVERRTFSVVASAGGRHSGGIREVQSVVRSIGTGAAGGCGCRNVAGGVGMV